MSEYDSSAVKEVIAGALCVGGIGASLILTTSSQEDDSTTLQLKDIDDFVNFNVTI